MHVSVEGGDLPGLKSLIQRMKDANRGILVGLPVGAKAEEDGTPVAMVGATHEFGSPEQNIPERSWLRGGIRRAQEKLHKVNASSLRGVVRGELTIEDALHREGVVAVGEVKREFTTAKFQPLKPATIAARKRKFGKASTRPLIASGNLKQEVTYQLDTAVTSPNARVIE